MVVYGARARTDSELGRLYFAHPMRPDPYPYPSDTRISDRMLRNRRRDTQPELAIRAALHRAGLRYRVDYTVRTAERAVRPDVVFTRARLAVFVDGCFWHRCPLHGNRPRANAAYWGRKLDRNVERDRAVDAALGSAGWIVLRFWEHEDPQIAAELVAAAYAEARRSGSS